MDISKLLLKIRPGERWVLRGETINDLEWLDSTVKPTQEELEDGQAQLDALKYREKRSQEYPPIGDALDALVHKENGDPTIWNDYVLTCNAVKARYPKPE